MRFVYDQWGKKYLPLDRGTLLEAFWNGGCFLWGISVGIGGTTLVFLLFLLGIGVW